MTGDAPPDETARRVLAEGLPVETDRLSFGLAGMRFGAPPGPVLRWDERGYLVATLHLVLWSEGSGARSIRGVREQDAWLLPPRARDEPDRVAPFLRGWMLALPELLAAVPEDALEGLMPSDFAFPSRFALRKPRTAEEFRDAVLPRRRG